MAMMMIIHYLTMPETTVGQLTLADTEKLSEVKFLVRRRRRREENEGGIVYYFLLLLLLLLLLRLVS